MSRKTFLAFSCVHRPVHDVAGCKWLVNQIAERQPNFVVNLGDFFDAECLSSHAKSKKTTLGHEYDSAGELLEAIHNASPRSKLIYMEGNHEQRMRRPEWSDVSDLLDYRKHIEPCKRWKHIQYRYEPNSIFRIGQVSFYHGFVTSRGAVKGESVKLGVPYGLTVSGHTHRPFPIHRITMGITPLPYWHCNVGTFIQTDVEYMLTKDTSLWGGAICTGWAQDNIRCDLKQHWEAEIVPYRMFWDGKIEAI